MQILERPSDFDLEALGAGKEERVFRNLSRSQLIEISVLEGECQLSDMGSVVVNTGKFTGRSPRDKFIVQYNVPAESSIDWGTINRPISPQQSHHIMEKMQRYAKTKKLYIQDLAIGNHPKYTLSVQIISELAWHALFAKNLFLSRREKETSPDFVILDLPRFIAQPEFDGVNSGTFIIIDFEKRIVLIGGTAYAGEIKKAAFSIMNKLLPEHGIFPMHCSANIGKNNQTALFFGLSGTGKTTLSSDTDRYLIGDDETGWGEDGVFNFEGGCYAKTLGLIKDAEPKIYEACIHYGTVLENVVIQPNSRMIDFDDSSLTENGRAAYPLEFLSGSVKSGRGDHPRNIFFLSADAFGVLPPISLLTREQAIYYFLSGFTSKLAGTELGLSKTPLATFSSCFAAPFLPLMPDVYATLLVVKFNQNPTKVWLVNTGWTGGIYGVGERIKLSYTRSMISAALRGELPERDMIEDEVFHLAIPRICPEVPIRLLNPVNNWKDRDEYFLQAKYLVEMFKQNEKAI
jgi:phosphoenolpyruvate carboxykinase (ATP)